MRKLLTALLLTVMLGSSLLTTRAQEADMAYFASFDGLDRVIARSWMAPMVFDDAATPQPAGTPMASTPAATPVTPPQIASFSVFVFLFDSDEHAATGWERLDNDLQKTVAQDSRAPMDQDLPLDDIGSQARGYAGDLTINNITTSHTFATVQDGPFVYSLTGMFSGEDGIAETQTWAEALVAAPMDRMTEQFQPDGTSRGGLWHKLNAVQPEMPENSTVIDFLVYPMENATPIASVKAVTLSMQSGNLANIPGIQDAHGVTYEQGATAATPVADSATPIAEQSGVVRISTWIMTFDSEQSASNAVSPLANTLSYPVDVNASSISQSQSNGAFLTSSVQSGTIIDRALPEGLATINVQQVENTVYAVAVFTIDGDPSPIAEDLVQYMMDTPASDTEETANADGTAEGGIWDRFPQPGDPLLDGTTPVRTAQPAI